MTSEAKCNNGSCSATKDGAAGEANVPCTAVQLIAELIDDIEVTPSYEFETVRDALGYVVAELKSVKEAIEQTQCEGRIPNA